MAGCLNLLDEDNVPCDSINRWSENVSSVLKSPTAIRKFYEYLNDQELEEGLALLQFWQRCRELIDYFNNHKPHKYEQMKKLEQMKRLHSERDDWEEEILSRSQKLLEFAIENVNFDEELILLESAILSEGIPQIIDAFKDVKNAAEDQLQKDGYPEFRAHILKKYGFLHK